MLTYFINPGAIVAKKWDPGILDPSRFSGQIRKVEARLGKLAKIRKVETDQESSSKRLGKLEVRPKKKKEEKKGPRLYFVWKLGKFDQIRKVGMGYQETQESSFGKLGKFIGKIRKEIGSLGKFVWKIGKKMRSLGKFTPHIRKVGGET